MKCRSNVLTFGCLLGLSFGIAIFGHAVLAAQQETEPPALTLDAVKPPAADWSVDITSPLGRYVVTPPSVPGASRFRILVLAKVPRTRTS